MKPRFLVIHHSAGPRDQSRIEIRAFHMAPKPKGRGWSDIGYHKIIEFDGRVYQGRLDNVAGAHAIGYNSRSLGICVVGNFDKYDLELNHPQWITLVQSCANLCKRYYISAENILYHRETFVLRKKPVEKSCPGTRFPQIDILRGTVAAYLKGGIK